MKQLYRLIFLTVLLCIGVMTQAQEYKRIVSLVPSVTQSIYQMGAQSRLVGCTSYCKEGVANHKPVVSSAVKMNVEKIVELKPDLVVASGLTNPKDIETLKKFDINVVTFMTPIAIEEIYNQFYKIGCYMGAEEKAGKIIAEARAEVQKIRLSRAQKKEKPTVFFQIGADPIFAVLRNTFMDNYITILGARNIATELEYGTVGREFVLAKNPDYIFIATMGIVGENEVSAWKQHNNLKAAKNNRVFVIESEIACQPTPVTFVQALKQMDQLMK